MTNIEIKEKLQDIFKDLFDDESIELFDEMTADDIEDWDSISHITLINEIERCFAVHFTTQQITGAKNVGQLIHIIEEKIL